jgi:hypothetical protein
MIYNLPYTFSLFRIFCNLSNKNSCLHRKFIYKRLFLFNLELFLFLIKPFKPFFILSFTIDFYATIFFVFVFDYLNILDFLKIFQCYRYFHIYLKYLLYLIMEINYFIWFSKLSIYLIKLPSVTCNNGELSPSESLDRLVKPFE